MTQNLLPGYISPEQEKLEIHQNRKCFFIYYYLVCRQYVMLLIKLKIWFVDDQGLLMIGSFIIYFSAGNNCLKLTLVPEIFSGNELQIFLLFVYLFILDNKN